MAGGKKAEKLLRLLDATFLGAFKVVRFLARILPPSVLVAIAYAFGYAMFYMRPGSREYLLRTLRDALPEVSDERQLRTIARKAFSAPFRSMLDMIFLERYGERIEEKLAANVNVPQLVEKVHMAVIEGKGGIFFSPHLGGISIVHAICARIGVPYTPLVLHPSLTPVPRYVESLALLGQSLGCDPENPVFYTGTGMDVVPKVQEHLRKGKRVGITYDMIGGTIVDLFGHPTAIASGIAHFAYDSGAPIVPGYLARGKDPLDFSLYLYDPLEYTLTGDRSTDVKIILDTVIKKGEELIRKAPEDWIAWFGLRQWRARAEHMLKQKASPQ